MHELTENLRANFLKKVCTIFTNPVSFQFKDAIQHSQYFTGVVADINDYGIWVKHLHIDTYAFFSFPIIGIVEEQYLPENDPRVEELRKEMKKPEPEPEIKYIYEDGTPAAPPTPPNYVDISSLTKTVKKR